MKDASRTQRRSEIETAAYDMLAEKGFAGTSMQGIARRAKASNETLYRWYGDKTGLFRALIEGNAAAVRTELQECVARDGDPVEDLRRIGPMLLRLLVSDRAVALNRAAAADPTDQLGQTLTEAGRNQVFPLIIQVISRLDTLQGRPPPQVGRLYLDLLVGDLQIRRAIGAIPAPSEAEIADRAAAALDHVLTLLAQDQLDADTPSG